MNNLLRWSGLLFAGVMSTLSCSTRQGLIAEPEAVGIAEGWQLQVPPMSKLSAGTVYRKDPQGAIFRVTTLSIPAETIKEGGFEYNSKIKTTANLIARFIGIGGVRGERDKVVEVQLAMKDVERQITDDRMADQARRRFWEEVEIRPKDKYYLIRETRAASQVNLYIARETLTEIGGEATLKKAVEVGASVKQEGQGSIIIQESYRNRMYLMFLPEEIKLSSAGLSGESPTFGLYPVKEVLGEGLNPDAEK